MFQTFALIQAQQLSDTEVHQRQVADTQQTDNVIKLLVSHLSEEAQIEATSRFAAWLKKFSDSAILLIVE